ncbi:MAG: Holliday junction resolvase RuvX [Planctomycetes bacterium]|nr:Holliday junction resolvase RuvX [Planctomycetota bacterium]
MSDPRGRLLGIDYGKARIGIAVSDALGINAAPLGFIRRESDQQAAQVIAALAAREKAVGIVIGMPINADGSYGGNARWVQQFRAALAKLTPLPITLVDERYSSSEAEEELRLAGKWPCEPGKLDAQAAAIVLRRHLDGER